MPPHQWGLKRFLWFAINQTKHFFNWPAKVLSSMILILLKERSSWLRFLSGSSASLGTSFKEFLATFSRRRSLQKLRWGRKPMVGPTNANYWKYLEGSDLSELIPISGQRKTSNVDWPLLLPVLYLQSIQLMPKPDQNLSLNIHYRCSHSLLFLSFWNICGSWY